MAEQQVNVKAKDEVLEGKYANVAQIQHNKEEFVVDFMTIFPPHGNLSARVIMSPGHFKRMISAMQENIHRYEQKFGPISESAQPDVINGFPIK